MTRVPPFLDHPLQRMAVLLSRQPQRLLLGLAGIPGSGKTTLTTDLQAGFRQQHPEISMQVLSMDGFHYSKAQLAQMPDPERAFARRGAPWTFDAAGFVDKIRDLRANTADVLWPDFEHDVGDPVADAHCVPASCRIVLVEGLYLLHREGEWAGLEGLFDEIWFLDTPPELARERLIKRHQQAWGFSREQASARIDASDSKNAALVGTTRNRADWRI